MTSNNSTTIPRDVDVTPEEFMAELARLNASGQIDVDGALALEGLAAVLADPAHEHEAITVTMQCAGHIIMSTTFPGVPSNPTIDRT